MGALRHLILAVAGLAATAPAAMAAELKYQLTDLESGVRAFAINNAGQMAGGHVQIFVVGDLNRNTLSASAKDPYPYILDGGFDSTGYAINSLGDVAGGCIDGLPEGAFIYSNGQRVRLGTLSGDYFSRAYGINDRKDVVGSSSPRDGTWERAFLYSNGNLQPLGTLGGPRSSARAINNRGQIVGAADSILADHFTYVQRAFLYENGAMRDLGTLGGDRSIARAINQSGQVVGDAENAQLQSHAFLYTDATMRDLGTLGQDLYSSANGINLAGQVVGRSYNLSDSDYPRYYADWRAFLYADGTMLDLNTLVVGAPGWHLCEAFAINDLGQIVGWGTAPDGSDHGFLLTPVPEPALLPFVGAAILALGSRRLRDRRLSSSGSQPH
ncbi:MAG: DUF3466 family protein [Bacillota bacterium]